jgi:hypothetical protein
VSGDLTEIKGIGEKRAEGLAELGINNTNGLATLDEKGASLLSVKLGVPFDTVQGWVNAAKVLQRREDATAPSDGISIAEWADKNIPDDDVMGFVRDGGEVPAVPVYEHFLTGKREVKSVERGN